MSAVAKIISGGQTGADRAGLEAARRAGIATGGTAPKGFLTELGPQPDLLSAYGLVEHASADYPARTEANVIAADATIVIGAAPDRGSVLTAELCARHGKTCRVVAATTDAEAATTAAWLVAEHEALGRRLVVNVAGNRESHEPGLEARATEFLAAVFRRL